MRIVFPFKFRSAFPLWLRLGLTAGWALLLVGVVQNLTLRYSQLPVATGRFPTSFLFYTLFGVAGTLLVLMYVWASNWLLPCEPVRARLGWLRWVGVIVLGSLPSLFFSISDWSQVFSGDWVRTLVYLVFGVGMVWLAVDGDNKIWSWDGIIASLIVMGVVVILCDQFRYVIDFPLSLNWSEGNRIWDYSVLFGRRLYIYPADQVIPAYIDIGRQSLWGLPFLFFNPDIRFMRFWNALVWTVPYILLGWVILQPRRRKMGSWLLFGGWALIFLTQGPYLFATGAGGTAGGPGPPPTALVGSFAGVDCWNVCPLYPLYLAVCPGDVGGDGLDVTGSSG